MDIVHYYLKLSGHFADANKNNAIHVTMDELTQILDCTRRNAQLLIRKMQKQGYIEWNSGLGRGNTSNLVLKQNRDQILMNRAKEQALRGQIGEAYELLHLSPLEPLFSGWLTEQFGAMKTLDEKDILRFPFYRPVLDLDPLHVIRRTEAHLIRQIFDTLVVYDPVNQVIRSGIAHHWEHDEDCIVWTLYLRKGVRFHHGRELNAADVAFTFRRIGALEHPDWVMRNIGDIEVIDGYTLRFRLTKPNSLFLHIIASERFSIVPEDLEQISLEQDFRQHPIGSGPFLMKENNETILALEAHERYYGGRPMMDRIEIWVWPDYKEHLISNTSVVKEARLQYFDASEKDIPARVLTQLEDGSSVLTFNTRKKGPLQDIRLRQAIHLALNREQMIEDLGGRREQPASGFNPRNHDASYGRSSDVQLAREWIDASDYNGECLSLYTYELKSNEEDAAWMKSKCAEIGVNIQIHILPIRELTTKEVIRASDMLFAGEVLGEEPTVDLISMYLSDDGYIRNHLDELSRNRVDSIIEEALAEPDPCARRSVLERIEEELKQRSAVLFMYHSRQTVGHDPSLSGITLNAWGKINYKDVWIKRY
ncbi:SgrR family transcriptional regulator [Paenibacillus dendrobii]|nr:SgrR family transcriptional regulator [Paenibacillus dendrobii]